MTIPNEFTQFKYLERLYASGCGLKELPGNLRHWGNLHELVIDDNEMTGIDNSIVDLRTLTKLSMNRNKLKRISKQISKLTKLREIHLNDNELVTIPEALCQVTHLQHLYANNNCLKTQPTRLRKLVRLQHLDLRHNELEVSHIFIDINLLVLTNLLFFFMFSTNSIRHSIQQNSAPLFQSES